MRGEWTANSDFNESLAGVPILRYLSLMTKLQKIELEIEALSYEELTSFGRWFDELRAQAWDDQIERDARSGKLDKLFARAKSDIAAGRVKPL